ncbi:DUF4224 domain-containing protein [Methylobacillus flagellatus]|uniref:DUF4224 domain-containing protein n=1 Tax=Methylobacillus flagellatus TaxID=405 RepID=UPI002868CE82|nr:DUF4224 domain-containing protein [Methylobacillus flagellatus]
MTAFLTPEDVATLTGIKRGRGGLTRDQLQVRQLAAMGVPHFINASGRPIVARAAIEGGTSAKSQAKQSWQPAVLGT